jgi:hypothetical protein
MSVRELDPYTGRAQLREAAPRFRIGIQGPGHDSRHSGVEDRARARRCRPEAAAGLERHVECRTAGLLAGGPKRDDLRMRAPLALVAALADNLPVLDDDGADNGIRTRRPAPALGELERALEAHRPSRGR